MLIRFIIIYVDSYLYYFRPNLQAMELTLMIFFCYPRNPCSRRDSPQLRWLPIHSVDHAMSEQGETITRIFYIYLILIKSSCSMATKEIH